MLARVAVALPGLMASSGRYLLSTLEWRKQECEQGQVAERSQESAPATAGHQGVDEMIEV
jgi:hypothetical protein